ncbi:MAG TPA: hypothetical protein GX005_04740 [Bacteroidales bacterium]|nr:hypothetical protein [Bacteroidales bacterium]
MKAKQILIVTALFLIPFFASAQKQTPLEINPWAEIPSGVYKLSVKGEVRVTVISGKTSHYDLGTDLKGHIPSGQEKYARDFVSNGTLTITPEITGSPRVLRLYVNEPLIEIEVSEGGLVVIDSKLSQASMTVRLNNAKLYSENKFKVDNFVLENNKGIIELQKAYLNSAILSVSQESKNNISGNISKQQIYVLKEECEEEKE